MSLFSGLATQKKSIPALPNCQACGMLTKCKHPTRPAAIRKNTDIAIVTEAPDEDVENAVALSNYTRLKTLLARLGKSLSDVTLIPVAACPNSHPEAWRHCQPLVVKAIKQINPKVLILHGKRPTTSVVSWLSQQPAGLYDRWYGKQIPSQELNAWVCPVGYLAPHKKNPQSSDFWQYKHMEAALALQERPYVKPPEYAKMVQLLWSDAEITRVLALASQASIVAFDIEATGLKPEAPGHEIVTLSLAWYTGDKLNCYAFPMRPSLHAAFAAFLQSPAKKIAHNMQYEARWCGHLVAEVKNLFWDSILAAHMLDPQEQTKSLDFQAFAYLGFADWSGSITDYFKTDYANQINRIHAAPMRDLLLYNGLDTITNLLLAARQMQAFGAPALIPSIHLPISS